MSNTKLNYDEESSEKRMNAIGQNGNTGDHYGDVTLIDSWTQTVTACDQRSMNQAISSPTFTANSTNIEGVEKQPSIIVSKQLPDARNHQITSFIKSAVRIVGYAFIPYDLAIATILLIFSEFVGIIEELV